MKARNYASSPLAKFSSFRRMVPVGLSGSNGGFSSRKVDRAWVRDILLRRRSTAPEAPPNVPFWTSLASKAKNGLQAPNSFDLPTAIVLAKCAFEAYSEPTGAKAFTEQGLSADRVVYMDRDYVSKTFEGMLRIDVRKGKSLLAADPWGKSDPYVTLQAGLSGAKTSVKYLTLDPEWNESLVLYVRDKQRGRLTMKVMDKDQVTADDLIGTAVLPLAQLCEPPPQPQGLNAFQPQKMLTDFLGGLFKQGQVDKDLKVQTIKLQGPKGEEEAGTIEIATRFFPFKAATDVEGDFQGRAASVDFADAWTELAATVHDGFAVPPQYQPVCFVENTETDTQCWVFKDAARKEIVFAFRGTEQIKWKDLATDASLMPTRMDPETFTLDPNASGILRGVVDVARALEGAKNMVMGGGEDTMSVHSGFLSSYYSVKARLMSVLDGLLDSGDWTVLITGHSLGGALATLFSFEVANRTTLGRPAPKHIAMYTYGSPRVGNTTFAKKFKELVPDSWRIHNVDDVVPMVPRLLGYCHVDTSVTLTPEGGLVIDSEEATGRLFEGQEFDAVVTALSQDIVKRALTQLPEGMPPQFAQLAGAIAGAEKAADMVRAAQGLSGQQKQALLDRIWEEELKVLNTLLDGRALSDHMESNYLKSLTLCFTAAGIKAPASS